MSCKEIGTSFASPPSDVWSTCYQNSRNALKAHVTVLDGITPKTWTSRDPILDVWRRQYLRTGFKQSPPAKAEIFSVCLRIPQCLLEPLLASSGNVGAYCEPRTADGKEILADYTVVWTPRYTLQEMQHLMRTNPAVTGLARLGERRDSESMPPKQRAFTNRSDLTQYTYHRALNASTLSVPSHMVSIDRRWGRF